MASSNACWRSSKPQSGHAPTQETRTHSVESVAAQNVHSQNASATSLPNRPLEAKQRASAPKASISKANVPEASSSKQPYIAPARRSRLTKQEEQPVAKQPVGEQPVAEQPVEFAVQLYPDMSSLTLAQHGHQQGSPIVFSGGEPPDHHNYTAFHHYIAHVSPNDAAAFGTDVWLDTFHTTLGNLQLPMSKVCQFQRSISTISDSLHPDRLSNLIYTTTKLGYTVKTNRLKADIKGVHFYHLGVTAGGDQVAESLQPWIAAMQRAAAAVGAKFVVKPFSEHHITIRCHTKRPVKSQAFQNIACAIQDNPMSLRVAGIRVQLAASQALEHCGPEHIMTHVGSDGAVVRYPVPIFTSGAAASVMLERGDDKAPCPPRPVPCDAPESEDGASIEELARLTAEPLVVRAQYGTGFVWQNERDSTGPKREQPTLPISAGYVPPNGDIGSSNMAASVRPEAKPVSTAAAFHLADLAGADPLPGGLLTDSDSLGEQLTELSIDANPAGLRPPKEGNKERGNLVPLKAHS